MFSYGRPRTPENMFTEEHWLEPGGVLLARSDADGYVPTFAPSLDHPAAELL
jgi:hypothetical protein